MEKIVIKTNYSKDSALEFFKFHLLHRAASKYMYFAVSIISLIIAVLFLTAIIFPAGASIFFLIAIGVWIVRPQQVKKIANKVIENNPVSNKEYIIIINEERIVYKMDQNAKEYHWEDIIVVCQTKDKLYLYITKNLAIIIPLYSLSPIQREQLIAVVKSKTKYRKYFYRHRYEEQN